MIEELDQVEEQQQQDPPSKTKALYDAVSKKYDLGTFDEFEKKLQDPKKRESFYNGVGSEYDLGTYQEFESKVKKKDGGSPLSTTTSPTQSPSDPPLQSKGWGNNPLNPANVRQGSPAIAPKEELSFGEKGFGLQTNENGKLPVQSISKKPLVEEHIESVKRKGEEQRVAYLWNKITKGIGGVIAGSSDNVMDLMTSVLPESVVGGTKQDAMKQWRDEVTPISREFFKKTIGSNVVTQAQEDKYDNEFLTSSVGGVMESLPAILSPKGARAVSLMTQAKDAALQSINSTEEGKSLPESTKSIFSYGVGTAQGLLEKYGIDKIFGKQSSVISRKIAGKVFNDLIQKADVPITRELFESALDAYTKTAKQQLINATTKLGKAAAIEFVTGSLQEGSTVFAESLLNKGVGKEIFEPMSFGKGIGRILKSGAQEAIGGLVLGGVTVPFSKVPNYISEKVAAAKSVEDVNMLREELGMEIDRLGIKDEGAIMEINQLIDDYARVNSKIPDTVPDRKKAADKIIEREELELQIERKVAEKESVDVAFQPEIEAEIEFLSKRVEEINNELVNPPVGEVVAEEAVAAELPDTYIINGKPVSQQEFDTAIDNAKNTKEALDVEYNGDDEVRIQKIIDLGGTSQAGTTTITDEAPTTTTKVTKPVQQDAGVPEQQGTKEAVSKSTEPIGQGNAETTTTVLEKEQVELPAQEKVGVGEDVEKYDGMFSKETTGVSGADDVLNDNVGGRKGYFAFQKRLSASIEMMSPDEYLKRVREGFGTTKDENIVEGSIKNIKKGIDKGDKIDMPYLKYGENGKFKNQEGRNRAVVAKERGEKLIPVLVERELSNDDRLSIAKKYVDEAISKGNKTKEEVINYLSNDKKLHWDAIRFIDNNFDDKAVEQSLKAGSVGEVKAELPAQEKVEQLRLQEQAEYDAMPNPKDEAERKRIYDKYDKLISPLLDEGEVKAEVPKPKEGKYEAKAKAIAEKIMAAKVVPDWLKIDDENVSTKGSSAEDLKKVLADAVINMGKLLDKGVEFSQAIKESVKAMIDIHGEGKRKEIEEGFAKYYRENEADVPPPSEPPVDKTKESEIKIVEDIEEQDLSGIRKKLVSDEIIKGVDLDRISDKEMMGLGRKILDSGEVKPEAIVTKIITEGKGVLTPTEVVALITYKRDIDNQLSDVYKKINEKKSAKEDIGTLGVEAKSLERQINDFDVMAVITAQQQSMAFRLRQRMLDRDYNVVTQIEKYKSVNNGEIPEEVESKLRELDKQLKEVKEKLVEAEKKIQEKEAQDAVNNIKESVDREKSYTDEELNKKIEEEVESEISKLYEELPEQKRSAADKAIKALEKFRVKLKSRAYESTLGIPIALADLGAVTAIRAIKIGKTVSEAVEIGINRIKKSLKEKGIDKWDQESEYRKDLSDTLEAEGVSTKNKIKDKPVINKDGTVTIPNDMLRDLVKRGVTDINDLVDEVHSKLVQELPEITKRQVRDYITGYGKTVNPTSDKLQTQINTAKRVGRLLSELEDLKKMGEVEFLAKYQKTKPSKNKILERERELKRQIKSLSKDIADIDNTKTDEERLILTKESVTRRIDELKRKIKNKDFSKNKKNQSVTDSELVELNKQKEKIQAEFDDLQYQNELKNRGTWQKVEDAAYEATSGLLRGLTLSLDMSAGLVQGMRKLFTNPGKSVKAFVESIKHLVSEKYSEDYLAKHKAQSYFPLIKASKLAIGDKSGKVSVKEGMFISNWINLVWDKLVSPVIGFGTKKGTSLVRKINPYLASQRAYDGYVNSIRIQSFLQIAKQIENDGYTFESNPEVFKKAADFVNTTTGRGSLGQADANSKWLNIFLTAPRKVISELKLYTPYALVYYSRMPKAVRKKAFLDFAKFATSFITTNALIWAATKNWDDEEEDKKDNFWNPNSSDFLTHKIGDNRISVAGGMKSIINFQSRFITGEFTDQYGKTTKLGERFGKDINTRFDLLTRFITGKSAPAFNVALKKLDERKGKEMSNEEIIKSLTVPLWMQDIKELYKDDPATVGAFLTAMSILGANVRSVEKSKSDIDKEELSKNPKLKYFIDKGYNFPEMNPEKIQTKEINNKVVERLSQYDDKTQKLYIETKKKHLADELEKLKNGHKIIYVDNEGGVSLTSSYNNKPKQFKDATKEQVQYIIINIIGSAISKKLKKDILEKKKPISKIKN